MTAPVASLRAVTKRFEDGKQALNGLDLEVRPGEILGLVGPNGSGKTTLLHILAGLTSHTSGEVSLFGESISGSRSSGLRKKVGFVSQDPALDPEMTVQEILNLFCALYGISGTQMTSSVDEVVQRLKLQEFMGSRIFRLSGGQRQRLHLAIAFLQQPTLLLLDEPTTSLDPGGQVQLWEMLFSFRTPDRSVVVTTHNLSDAENHFDRLAIMARGSIIGLDTPEKLRAREHSSSLEEAYYVLAGEKLQEPGRRKKERRP